MPDTTALHKNRLLAALPADTAARLLPHLELIRLSLNSVLFEPGDSQRYAYFPTDAIVCQLYETDSGASAEVSSVGSDGMVSVSLFMGGDIALYRTVVLNAGQAYRLKAQKLKEEFDRGGDFQR
ncbi:MAG TPA: Crp/Fnr family transcriptional regulator, partial [Pseudomonadales bacterium]|nr:Crp/Fnr family transcriptional regulator [Pseudomonadales bacterium]